MTWKCCFFVSGFIFECKPKRTFYENSVCVNNICCWKCVALKKSKSLSFFSWETFLKSECVKGNHENMKSHDGILCHHGSKNEGMCFFSKFFKGKFSEKKIAATLKRSEKQVLPKVEKLNTSYVLRVHIHELRVQIHGLRVQIHELRVQIYELWVQIYELRVQIYQLEDAKHELQN